MAVSASASVDRISKLSAWRSKLKEEDLEILHEKYDLPEEFTVSLPEKDSAIHEYSDGKLPLYTAHLEYGLRFPLPPFVRRLCERLGVSPMQFAPNAIATIMAFLVICHRVKVEPTLQLFSNLVSVKATKKDAHFFFGTVGGRLVDIPESNKDWKERFVWVFGADAILACRAWPEIEKDKLKALPLSADERRDLEKIRQYSGSRKVYNLFDNASLRSAGLSFVRPTEADKEREEELLRVDAPQVEGSDAGALVPTEPSGLQLPQKRARGGGLSAAEEQHVERNFDEMAAMLKPKASSAQADKAKKKKSKAKKPKSSTAKESAEVADRPADDAGVPRGDSSAAEESSARELPPSSLLTRGDVQEESGLPLGDVLDQQAEGVLMAVESAPVDRAAATASPEPTQRSGKELASSDESAPKAALPSLLESLGIQLPFHHRISDIGIPQWKELRSELIGNLWEGYSRQGEPFECDKFVPGRSLHKEDSVFRSGWAQLVAAEQFSLPKDKDFLQEVPSTGLRLALLSYQTRGALLGEELFNRLYFMMQVADDLAKRLTREKASREEADKKAASLEAEKEAAGEKWRVDMESKQAAIANLQIHHSKQAETIRILKDEVAQLKGTTEGLQREAAEWKSQVGELESQVEVKRLERQSAQECLRSERLDLQNLEVELDELKVAPQAALDNVRTLKAQLDSGPSEEKKRDIIEEYRQGPLGKVELSLAMKAGFDYLKARIPSDVVSLSDIAYPPRVQSSLSVLRGLEERGAGVDLGDGEGGEVDVGDEDEEDEDEEDDDDEGGGNPGEE